MILRPFIHRFCRAESGVSAVEFAFVAPVLLLFMMGIIEFAMIMLVYNIMESATTISARLGATGYTTAGISREQTILNSITARAGNLITPSKLSITAKYYTQFDQIGDPEPYIDSNHNGHYDVGETYTDVNGNGHWDADMGTAGLGGAGDIVVYSVSYPWGIVTPIISNLIGTNGTFTITTHAVTKNEPF